MQSYAFISSLVQSRFSSQNIWEWNWRIICGGSQQDSDDDTISYFLFSFLQMKERMPWVKDLQICSVNNSHPCDTHLSETSIALNLNVVPDRKTKNDLKLVRLFFCTWYLEWKSFPSKKEPNKLYVSFQLLFK